jgi:predicted nucleic acid-binding protein
MPRGRRPASRSVYSFEDTALILPAEVVLDTSFIVDALLPKEELHRECREFLVRLAEGGTVVFFSRLLELELFETTYRLALKERFKRDWRQRRLDGRARRRASRLSQVTLDAWNDVLAALNHGIVEIDEIADTVPGLMARFGLSSYDAVHVATALFLGVRNMVTLDSGFSAVPPNELQLYVNRSRVAWCRSARGKG